MVSQIALAATDPKVNFFRNGAFKDKVDVPALKKRLVELISSAAYEIVRCVTPVVDFRRTTTRDVEIGGVLIPEGEKVIIYYASANRDESVRQPVREHDRREMQSREPAALRAAGAP